MTLKLLCIANPTAYAGVQTDIPLSYARLAAHPGITLFHANTNAMLREDVAIAAAPVPPSFRAERFEDLESAPTEPLPPTSFDVAFCRTLKPFPDGYLSSLRARSPALRFVNDPTGIERQLAPGFVLRAAAQFMPPAIATADVVEAGAFFEKHSAVVAKRANSCGGRGVFRVHRNAQYVTDNVVEGSREFRSFEELHAYLSVDGTTPLLWMRYLPRVREGERRIVVVDGEVYGAYLRRSAQGHWVQNLSMGAVPSRVALEPGDARIVEETHGLYRDHGIHILGYDLLLDDDGAWKVSEINAGNIGGLFRLESMGVPGVTDTFVRWLNDFARAA